MEVLNKKLLIKILIIGLFVPSFGFASNLITAIKSGDVSALKLEIANNAELNEKFDLIQVDEETTPLMLAAHYGYFDIVELLVKNGADVFARNSVLDSALTIAQRGGFNDIVDYLLPYFRAIKYDFFGASEDIEWANSLDDALELSKKEAKYVMVVFMRIGCKWSKKMGEGSFQDEMMVSLINKSFIPVLIDKEVGDYPRDKFDVKYTPTLYFLNSEMDIKNKLGGFRDSETLIKELKEVIERKRKKE